MWKRGVGEVKGLLVNLGMEVVEKGLEVKEMVSRELSKMWKDGKNGWKSGVEGVKEFLSDLWNEGER
uniref:hypothetical protein n=1 Tax=Bacillus thuringiensis TaxID=1428 RepID=UPI00119E9820